jgi:oligopeptidase B
LYTAPAIPNCENVWSLVRHYSNGGSVSNTAPLFDGSVQSSLEGVTCFQNHVVAYGREYGLPQIWILGTIHLPTPAPISMDLNEEIAAAAMTVMVQQFERLTFDEDAYDVGLGTHYEYNTSKIMVMYDSMITPTQSIEIDLYNPTQRTNVKEKVVPGYDKTLYQCERRMVMSRDGMTQIPISMVYRKDVMELHQASDQPLPVHLYGYGSYGASMECDFVSSRLPLLQRKMMYVVAHVRGGSEMGRHWYEEPSGAKYLCKQNSFYDFCDVAHWLIHDAKYTNSNLLSCEGRSAGGLLIGASINLAPELFKVAILGVPFVDVVPTMIDARIALTSLEWEEWGNPNEIKYFQYMMDYTPTFNVRKAAKYPACLLTGGFHDPRVQVRTVFYSHCWMCHKTFPRNVLLLFQNYAYLSGNILFLF